MEDKLIQLFLAASVIGIICYGTYKVLAYIMDKLSTLILHSRAWKFGALFLLSLFFLCIGCLMLYDVLYDESPTPQAYSFPFQLGLSGVLIYLVINLAKKGRK